MILFGNKKVNSSQRDLYATMFEGYQSDLRPVRDDSTQMIVQVQLHVWSLLEVVSIYP